METSTDILNELKEWAPVLSKMDKRNVFTVPEGYFEGLAANILYTIQGQTVRPAVPEGYFDSLADSILRKIKSQERTQPDTEPLSPLLESLRKVNVFTVPEGYFDTLGAALTAQAASSADANSDSPLLESVRGNNVFTLPQGYFDTFSAQVLERVDANEVPLSPQLLALRRVNAYTVPQGYFEALPGRIMAQVQPQQAKVLSLRSRLVKLAAAAVLTGAMALGVYKYVQPQSEGTTLAGNTLTAIQLHGLEIAQNAVRYDNEMEKVSDEEIVTFLESSGTDIDAALVAATVDEQELPGTDDYLLNENALEEFLNDSNNKNLNN